MLPELPTLEEITEAFAWQIPDSFNIGVSCCDVWAEREPERIALRQWNRGAAAVETSYGELKSRSDAFARYLVKNGAKPGDRIAIILPQSVETVIAHLAIYKAGMIAVPLARLFGAEALEYRLNRAGVSVAVTNRDGCEKIASIESGLDNLEHVVCVGEASPRVSQLSGSIRVSSFEESAREGDGEKFIAEPTKPDTPALIIFTSGTTGPPKGALHGHRVLLGHIPGVQEHHEFLPKEGDIAWTPADWAWAGGLLNILLPCLYLGVPVAYGGIDRFDPELAFELMQDMTVANAFIPPTALRLMKTVEEPVERFDLKIRTIGSGGESLGRETLIWAQSELGIVINEFYGQTECNLVLSSCNAIGVLRPGAIGKPVPGHEVGVLGDDGKLCKTGERGQVAVKSPDPVMFLGYWEDEAATSQKFAGDWMLTGDQCVMDEDGYFHFVGRDDDIINSAGYRVGPGEIEDCLITHPAVKLAAAVGKPDKLRTEIVKAYIVLADGHRSTDKLLDDVKQHVKARLAANIYPREIDVVEEIPLTTTGKVIRRIFREQAIREAGPG
ncbi:MAG: AMP-binding protein [Rhizobiaceae bacterium]